MPGWGAFVAHAFVVAMVPALISQCGGAATTTGGLSDASATRVCVPGASVACAGPGACDGFQVCRADGSGFAGCNCAATGGGPSLDGATGPGDNGYGPEAGERDAPDGGASCLPGATTCFANSVGICSAQGEWQIPTTCVSSACVSGACTGVCVPGAQRCLGAYSQPCGASGAWTVETFCTGGCVDGTCSTTPGECPAYCTQDSQCAASCPAAPNGGSNCCDQTAGSCYLTITSSCPAAHVGGE